MAPKVIATTFLLGNSEFTKLHNSATIETASGCFLRPSRGSSNITALPSSRRAVICSEVTGSSNRSECIEGTNSIGVSVPRAAERAIVAGESMSPWICFEMVFLVAGATSIAS